MKKRDVVSDLIGVEGNLLRISSCSEFGQLSVGQLASWKERVLSNRTLRHSGTTIIAFLYRHGVIMAADRQTTSGWEKEFESVKIHAINDHVLIGAAGLVSLIQTIRETVARTGSKFESFLGASLDVDAYARITERMLKENFIGMGVYADILGYIAVPIIAGVNPHEARASLYSFDGAGAIYDHVRNSRKFASVGSGSLYAKSVLEQKWAHNMTESDAIECAVEAIYRSGSSDIGSGHADINPPLVLLVTTSGTQQVAEESVRSLAWNIRINDCRRRGDTKTAKLYSRLLKEAVS